VSLRVAVALALPERQDVVELELPTGSRVADALDAPAARTLLRGFDRANLEVGIWSRPCRLDAPLHDGDRVEIYRPLVADPKDMRRARAASAAPKDKRR
jgi:putative ubiquitin-RnfH superfamily antitoxin RatB of RatAB toxin-antitoxin module